LGNPSTADFNLIQHHHRNAIAIQPEEFGIVLNVACGNLQPQFVLEAIGHLLYHVAEMTAWAGKDREVSFLGGHARTEPYHVSRKKGSIPKEGWGDIDAG
jgi:hypothetical protein